MSKNAQTCFLFLGALHIDVKHSIDPLALILIMLILALTHDPNF